MDSQYSQSLVMSLEVCPAGCQGVTCDRPPEHTLVMVGYTLISTLNLARGGGRVR